PGRRDQTDAVAGIYKSRTSDFEDVAREAVRNRSHSCGGNERASSTPFLISPVCCEKRNYRSLTSILSPRTGRGGIRERPENNQGRRRRSPLPFANGEDKGEGLFGPQFFRNRVST